MSHLPPDDSHPVAYGRGSKGDQALTKSILVRSFEVVRNFTAVGKTIQFCRPDISLA